MDMPEIYKVERYVYGRTKERRYVLKYNNREGFASNLKDLASFMIDILKLPDSTEIYYKNAEIETIHCIGNIGAGGIEARVRTGLTHRELKRLARIIAEGQGIESHEFVEALVAGQKQHEGMY